MKKIFLIVALCGILFSACKKENEDYRDRVIGTYTGILHYYPNEYSNNYTVHTKTTEVTKSDTIPDILVFTGGLTNYNTYNFKLNSNYSIVAGFNNGYFTSDSLYFKVTRNHVMGKYFLRKN